MSLTRLQRLVIDALEDVKARDIQVFNTTGLTDLFDRVVIASATSNRQGRALAHHVRDQARAKGYDVIATEGEDGGEWVLVDLGDIVVHIMQPDVRAHYNLEEIWGGRTVRVRLGDASRPRASASSTSTSPATGGAAEFGAIARQSA